MYKIIKYGIVGVLLWGFTIPLWGENNPPCKYPPFLGKSAVIPPHIIFVMDYSGSMSWMPYPNDNRDRRSYNYTYHDVISFGGRQLTYAGQFKPRMYYRYNTQEGYFEPIRPRTSLSEPPIIESGQLIDGNFLNFSQNMNRTTILKLVLMGDNNYTYSSSNISEDKIIVKLIKQNRRSYYYFNRKKRLVIEYRGGAWRRDGYTANPYIGGEVRIYVQKRIWWWWSTDSTWFNWSRAALLKDKADARGIFEEILDKDMDGYTDVDAPSVSIITYQSSSARIRVRKSKDISTLENSLNTTYASGGTPTRYGVQRARDIVRYTTGNPSNDIYYEYVNGLPMGLYCKKVYTIVLTDGNWNTGGDPLPYVHNYHISDLRGNLQGKQNIIFFTMFMFGSGGGLNSQKWLALFGGFEDVYDGNNWPGTYTRRPRSSNNNFYARTAEADYVEWDNDRNHLPDKFYEVYNSKEMKDAFHAILNKIKETVTAASAAPNSPAASVRGEGMSFQAVFLPALKDSITNEFRYWLGELRSLFVDPKGNLREDTNGDKELDLVDDRVVTFYFDTNEEVIKAATYEDSNGDGIIDSTELSTEVRKSVFALNAIWKASDWLNTTNSTNRRIYYVDENNNLRRFNTTAANELKSLFALSRTQAESLITYIRGEDYGEIYRSRTISGRVWRLGDIIHSTPAYLATPMERYDVLYGDTSYAEYYRTYKDKRGVIFVGANDGMLHAFNAGVFIPQDDPIRLGEVVNNFGGYRIGEELWAIIPHNLLPHLRWLWWTGYDICHVYYVDGKPKLTDVKIFTPDAIHKNGWGTVLSIGYNFGGDTITVGGKVYRSAYTVLDVTDPLNPSVLMEFTDPYLGFTTSYPAFGKVDSTWFMFIGSGPNKLSGESSQSATFYIIDNHGNVNRFAGNDFAYNSDAYIGSPISVDVDLDYNVDYVYFGVNYHDGSHWKGQLYKIVTYGDDNPANWTLVKLADVDGPITAPPSISKDEKGRLWVYFGTGKYMGPLDATDSSTQYIVGIKDENTYVSGASVIDVTDYNLYTNDTIAGTGFQGTFEQFEEFMDTVAGWYIRLPLGERVLEKPAVVGGALFVTTYSPMASSQGNPCDAGNVAFGGGHLFALYYKTGTAHPKMIFGESGGEVLKSVSVGGMPSSPEIHVGEGGEVTVSVQTSEGGVQSFDVNLPFSIRSGIKLWKGGF